MDKLDFTFACRGMRARAGIALLVSAFLATATVTATAQVARPADGAALEGNGWTGLSHPDEVIRARQLLMSELAHLMRPLDLYGAGEEGDLATMRANASAISAFLAVTPHLFPPTTNVYEQEEDAARSTVALPVIWEEFDAFFDAASKASSRAHETSLIEEAKAFRAAAVDLRRACDACHARFMQEYSLEIPEGDDVDLDGLLE